MTGKSVVLGVDRSPGAERAREVAVTLARALGVPLVLVHGMGAPGGVGEEADEVRDAIEEIDDVLTRPVIAAADAAGVRTVVEIVDDQPAPALVAVADAPDAEVIVVGIWNESPLRGFVARLRRAQAAAAVRPAGAVRAAGCVGTAVTQRVHGPTVGRCPT
jgi:nucleotide-binding universal stress UspA family protein